MKIITIWCAKGGVGKSCLAKNLAAYLSMFEKSKVLVIDKDSQRSIYANFAEKPECPFDVVDKIPQSFDGYDYVICDLPPLTENTENPLSVDQILIIENSDLIVAPFYPDGITIQSMLSIYEANTDATIQPVLVRYDVRRKKHKKAVGEIEGCMVIKDRSGAYDEMEPYQTLFDKMSYSRPLSHARHEFKVLARQLLKEVE